jgi:hypothetical protein
LSTSSLTNRACGREGGRLTLALTAGLLLAAAACVASAAQPASPLDRVKLVADSLHGTPGFFRVGTDENGRWWLVDPAGRPFLYRGVTSINRAGTIGGRRAQPGPYAAAVEKRYGAGPEKFVAAVLGRLRRWHFNALGAWCTAEFHDQGMAYTEIIEFNKVGTPIRRNGVYLPDIYDPQWLAAVDAKCRELCTPRRASKPLVGYFTDNELGWGQTHEELPDGAPPPDPKTGRPRMTLLQVLLSLTPPRPAREAAWEFVLQRHNQDLAEVARAWALPLKSREQVAEWSAQPKVLATPGFLADHEAFSREFARRSCRVCAEAIRKYDPNHLILGCRFGGPPGPAVLGECKRPWVDVLSANNYRMIFYSRVQEYHQPERMPVLIGEYGWYTDLFPKGSDASKTTKAGVAVLEKAFTHPALVGYTWYRWVSATPDTPNLALQAGLVNHQDEANEPQTRALTEVNARLEEIAVRAAEERGRKK